MSELIRKTVIELEPELGKISDDDLVSRIVNGGMDSEKLLFFLLYGRMAPMLEAVFRKFSTEGFDFDDFMLELHLKLCKADYQALRNFKHESTVKTYISNIAHNWLVDQAGKKILTVDIDAINDMPYSDEYERDRLRQLVELIKAYPDPDVRFIMFKQLEGYDRSETAALLSKKRGSEVTTGYVNTLFSRACRKMRSQREEEREMLLSMNCYIEEEIPNRYFRQNGSMSSPEPRRVHNVAEKPGYSITSIFRKMLEDIFE